MELDGVNLGALYSKNALEKNALLASPSFFDCYRLVARQDLTATSTGVINDGSSDTSEVFHVKAKEYKHLFFTASYSSSQTATQIIAAPGAGKKIVLEYLAMRSTANTGTAYITSGQNIGTTYFEAQNSFSSTDMDVDCPANTAVTLTTTTTTSPLTVAVQYHIEEA